MNINLKLLAAHLAHEINKVHCESLGDFSQVPFEQAEEHQRNSSMAGVEAFLRNPDLTPEQTHQSWMDFKLRDGWVFGPVKDPVAKTHPSLVPYDQLSKEERTKDHLFRAVMRTVLPYIQEQQDTQRVIQAFLASPHHIVLEPPDDALLHAVLTVQDIEDNKNVQWPAHAIQLKEDYRYIWLVPFEGKSYWIATNAHVMSIRQAAEVEVPHPFAFFPSALEGLEYFVDEPSFNDLAGGYLVVNVAETSLKGSLMVYFHYETGDVVPVKSIDCASHLWGKDRSKELEMQGFDYGSMLERVIKSEQVPVPAHAELHTLALIRVAKSLPSAASSMTCDAEQCIVALRTPLGAVAIMPTRVLQPDFNSQDFEQRLGDPNPVPSQEATQGTTSDGTL